MLGSAGMMLFSSDLSAGAPTQRKTETGTYLIPANDGYGVADCLAGKQDCGRIVADAWCKNNGHGKALAYGVADRSDFTGSVAPKAGQPEELPLVVTCGR